MSTSPVYVHHVVSTGSSLLGGLDHLGALCLTALHLMFDPVHRLFHFVLAAGVLYATWDRVRAWRLLRRTLGPLAAEEPVEGDAFWRAARDAGIDPRLVRVVEGLPNPAFTAGWLQPRVYAAASLVHILALDELAAVLAHEGAHVARRDPLRLSLLRFFACTLFWIPALRRLADDLADDAEVLADDAAAAGRPLVLASAILALAQWRSKPPALRELAAAGILRLNLLERRIRRLAGQEAVVRSHLTRRSAFAAAFALVTVWISGLLAAHPLAAQERGDFAVHCEHHDGRAFEHLFCLGLAITAPDGRCPHDHDAATPARGAPEHGRHVIAG